jgi:hypothetical protein
MSFVFNVFEMKPRLVSLTVDISVYVWFVKYVLRAMTANVQQVPSHSVGLMCHFPLQKSFVIVSALVLCGRVLRISSVIAQIVKLWHFHILHPPFQLS